MHSLIKKKATKKSDIIKTKILKLLRRRSQVPEELNPEYKI